MMTSNCGKYLYWRINFSNFTQYIIGFPLGGANFWIFNIFQYLTTEFLWQKKRRPKYKRCFSLFSCLPVRKWVFGAQKEKKSLNRVTKFVSFRYFHMSIKNPKFYAVCKMGQFIFVSSSYQKLMPKSPQNEVFWL
jgi:hypothetical protein